MKRSGRLQAKDQINYAQFHKTGDKELSKVIEDLSSLAISSVQIKEPDTMTSETKSMSIDYKILDAEIADFIDEHQITPTSSLKSLEKNVSKLENLRNNHRSLFYHLQESSDQAELPFTKEFNQTQKNAKKLLIDMNNAISSREEVLSQQDLRIVNDIKSSIRSQKSSLKSEISIDLSKLSDAEITKRNTNVCHLERHLTDLDSKITQLIQHDGEEQREGYDILLYQFQTYKEKSDSEINKREVEKHKLMLESKLKIQLKKFGGYDSAFDIFTFQDKFEKFHLRTTPKHLLPDLLKINYLESTALSLVKDSNDIDEIWKRLKKSFGDPQVMLTKKLQQFDKLNVSMKSKSHEKTIEALGELISLIKDTMKLAKQHNVEGRLYYSNSLERICKLIGEHRQTR